MVTKWEAAVEIISAAASNIYDKKELLGEDARGRMRSMLPTLGTRDLPDGGEGAEFYWACSGDDVVAFCGEDYVGHASGPVYAEEFYR